MVGQTVSHYQVLETLGGGSMGVVYKAMDTQLDRPVALKVLRPQRVADSERRERFVREAKAASALNHPNIVTIHEIGETDGVHFICMEWVRGKTLADLIRRQTLSPEQALSCGIQIADALAAAHDAGIIHRDLKPANIMVTEEGLVKVLDFGLAKLTQPHECAESAETVKMEPGVGTEPRVIEGTPAYMSPEQADGQKPDARNDIFSFGAVLYETLTGQRAFKAGSHASTLASVLRDEPRPATSLVPSLPPEVDRIITRCLRKDPRRRYQHMDDVHVALLDVKEQYEAERSGLGSQASETAAGRHPAREARRWKILAAASVLLAGTLVPSTWWFTRARPPATTGVVTRLTWDLGVSTDPTLSSNARLLAYASDRGGQGNLDLWVRHESGGVAIRLTHSHVDEHEPTFSPDSSLIAFRSERDQGGIYVVPSFGGMERLVARYGRRPRFSPDGKWIAYWVRDLETNWGKIYLVGPAGGSARPVRSDFPDAHFPVWSPDGKHLLFCGTSEIKPPTEDVHDWWVADVERGTVVRTGAFAAFHRRGLPRNHMPDGWFGDHVVFASRAGDGRNLWQIGISPRTGRVTAEPERLTFGTGVETNAYVAADGHVAFASGIANTGLWNLPIQRATGRAAGKPGPLVHTAGTVNTKPSLSEDGRRCAFVSDRDGHDEIYLQELDTGREIALTSTPPEELAAIRAGTLSYGLQPDWPVMSRDGLRVAYLWLQAPSSPRAARQQSIYVVPSAGGQAEKVCEDCGRPTGWSADGRRILFEAPGARTRVGALQPASGRKSEILRHEAYSFHEARFSPDDRWIAFRANVGQGRMRVFIAPYRDGPIEEGEWIPVTDGSAHDSLPRWSADGELLYFFSNLDGFPCIRARRLAPATRQPLGEPFVVYRFADARHPPSARFLFCVARDRIVCSLDDLSSNIWMTQLRAN